MVFLYIHYQRFTHCRPPSSRPLSARSRDTRPLSARSDTDRHPSARDRKSSAERDRPTSASRDRRPSSARRRNSMESSISASRKQKIQQFKENKSAKTIQKHWRSHQETKVIRFFFCLISFCL